MFKCYFFVPLIFSLTYATKDTTKGCKKWNMHYIQLYFIGVELPKKINKIIAVKNGKTYFSLVNTGFRYAADIRFFAKIGNILVMFLFLNLLKGIKNTFQYAKYYAKWMKNTA